MSGAGWHMTRKNATVRIRMPAPSSCSNSPFITHLANCPSPNPPAIFSDESSGEVARVTYCRAATPDGKCVWGELALRSWLLRVEVLCLRLGLIVRASGLEENKVQNRAGETGSSSKQLTHLKYGAERGTCSPVPD